MPNRVGLSAPQSVPLGRSLPDLPPAVTRRPLTSDENQVANSTQAAGTDLITRAVNDVGQIIGIGGNVDFTA